MSGQGRTVNEYVRYAVIGVFCEFHDLGREYSGLPVIVGLGIYCQCTVARDTVTLNMFY